MSVPKSFIVIAYYTINTPYEVEIEKLKHSLSKFNIDNDIVGVPNLGSWEKNTHYKAIFVREMMEKHSERSLLYVDADAVFREYPNLIPGLDCDVALRYQDFNYRKNEALSGTVYFANNDVSKQLVDKWISINVASPSTRGNPESYEQYNLAKAINSFVGIKIYNLPPEYTFIFDSMRRIYPNAKPVIEHFQASRKLAKLIK